MDFYTQGFQLASTIVDSPQLPFLGLSVGQVLSAVLDNDLAPKAAVSRFTDSVQSRRFWAGVRAGLVELDKTPPGDHRQPQPQLKMNTCILTALVASLNAIAASNNNIAEAIKSAGGSAVVPKTASTPATPAAGAAKTPAAGGGTPAANPGLAKAQAAAKAKREQAAAEKAAADAAALEGGGESLDDLSLLDGGGDADAATGVTMEDLRGVGMRILQAKKQKEMKAVLDGLGAASISALDPAQYDEALPLLEGILL